MITISGKDRISNVEDKAFLPKLRDNYYRIDELKKIYRLEKHVEGGWFSEVYTAPFSSNNRALAGSIYFLLEGNEISHFHQIDCDELWFYHEGCGMKITVLTKNEKHEYFLGGNLQNEEFYMAVIPKGAVFAAENLDKDNFTFVSCVTTPKFLYSGFRLVGKNEVRENFPNVEYLAYEKV